MRHALWIVVVVLAAACGREEEGQAPVAAEQVRAQPVTKLLSRDASGLRVESGPKGKRLRLNGNFESAAVARLGADGKVQTECFDEAAPAEAFLAGSSSVSSAGGH
jgi:hypothetical protein